MVMFTPRTFGLGYIEIEEPFRDFIMIVSTFVTSPVILVVIVNISIHFGVWRGKSRLRNSATSPSREYVFIYMLNLHL